VRIALPAKLRRWYRENVPPPRLLICWLVVAAVVCAVVALLVWALVLALRQPEETKAVVLAAIGTGVALLLVSARALQLEVLRFRQAKEPLLGIMWREPSMYPFSKDTAAGPRAVYAEYILWNAGIAPILVQQPVSVLAREFTTHHLGGSRDELLRPVGGTLVAEEAFPIILRQGETAIWRHYTGEQSDFRPTMSETITRDQTHAVRFIRDSEGDRKFVFAVIHFAALPADARRRDLRSCFVGFAYNAPAE